MPLDFTELKKHPRLLMEARLQPVQGNRFQPTGFPDLGAAEYTLPDGTPMLLVESAQSMANRLESVCWDEGKDEIVNLLKGMPYVKVKLADSQYTCSLLESHRINSPYILESEDKTFYAKLQQEMGTDLEGPVNLRNLAQVIFSYDPNSILHGIFIAKKELAGGRLRLQRILSSFVEAKSVKPVASGGVKNDRVNPSGDTGRGFGNVPFYRMEFVAQETTAFFNLDLATLTGYGLPNEANDFLITLALWKIYRLLECKLRFRTACDLECPDGLLVTRPKDLLFPTYEQLEKELPALIQSCQSLFADPPVTEMQWKGSSKKAPKKKGDENDSDNGANEPL